MNPTYHVGDTVQILSRQEVLSHPMADFANHTPPCPNYQPQK